MTRLNTIAIAFAFVMVTGFGTAAHAQSLAPSHHLFALHSALLDGNEGVLVSQATNEVVAVNHRRVSSGARVGLEILASLGTAVLSECLGIGVFEVWRAANPHADGWSGLGVVGFSIGVLAPALDLIAAPMVVSSLGDWLGGHGKIWASYLGSLTAAVIGYGLLFVSPAVGVISLLVGLVAGPVLGYEISNVRSSELDERSVALHSETLFSF